MVQQDIFKKVSILIALAVLIVLSILIIWPLATSIAAGLLLAYVFYPVYKKILYLVKEKNISSIIIILLVLFLILIPLWLLLPFLVRQVFNTYLLLQNIDVAHFINLIFPSLAATSGQFTLSINNFITNLASSILSSFSSLIMDLPNLMLKTIVVLFVFFFGMRDGKLLIEYVKSLSPFSKSTEEVLVKKFKNITNAVVYGLIIIGILQGICTGIGLFIFGVPNALLLTLIAIFMAIIPVLGAWVVWIPASIYLLTSGKTWQGIGLFLFGAIIISWIDNIIRSYIISKHSKVSLIVVLVGMIGGLIVFGILGLIIGPLILAYLLLILDAYRNKRFPNLFS